MGAGQDVAMFSAASRPALVPGVISVDVLAKAAANAKAFSPWRDAFQREATVMSNSLKARPRMMNNEQMLPGAGGNTLDSLPDVLGLGKLWTALETRYTSAFNVANNVLRYGGVAATAASFGISLYNLITTWKEQTPESKALNTTATAATGAATFEGVQFLRGAASASRLMGAWLGVAGAIYQSIKAYKEFDDPTKTSGQRGFATTAAVLSTIGAIACFIPGGQVIGFPLLVIGGLMGAGGDWLGKMAWANTAFSWVGDKVSGAFDAAKGAVTAVTDFAGAAVDKVSNLASGAWHAVASIF